MFEGPTRRARYQPPRNYEGIDAMKDNKKKSTKIARLSDLPARGTPADINEQIADDNEPFGTTLFNFYYTVCSLPAPLRDVINDAVSNLAEGFNLPDPNGTRGEVLGFRRLVKVCKAAADQEREDDQE